MKINLLILSCLLFSCSKYKENTKENILSESAFEVILKEIHLADAYFVINKNITIPNNDLDNTYFNIYEKHKITKTIFEETLNYYAENPEKLERIYTNILKKLNEEKSNFDLK